MGKPAARINDMHVCPMQTPRRLMVPQVSRSIIDLGIPTVLSGGMPASVLGDSCTWVGSPDSIMLGCAQHIGDKPAIRTGDTIAHSRSVVMELPTVLIGA